MERTAGSAVCRSLQLLVGPNKLGQEGGELRSPMVVEVEALQKPRPAGLVVPRLTKSKRDAVLSRILLAPASVSLPHLVAPVRWRLVER